MRHTLLISPSPRPKPSSSNHPSLPHIHSPSNNIRGLNERNKLRRPVKIAARPNLIANLSAPAALIIGNSGVFGVPERGYACGCGENRGAVLRLGESNAIGIPRERHDLGRIDVDMPSADRLRCGVKVYLVRIRDDTVRECELSEEGVGDASVLPEKSGS